MQTLVQNKHWTSSDKNATILPLKEQTALQRSHQNSNLEAFTIEQAKEKSKRVSLNRRWGIIGLGSVRRHGAVAETSCSSCTGVGRRSFLEFPAEIRNQVYEYILKTEHILLCSHYLDTTNGYRCKHYTDWTWYQKSYESDVCFRGLAILKQLNRLIRSESISYYFSNNKFMICASSEWRPKTLWELHIPLLVGIQDNLARLRHLTIKGPILARNSEENYENFIHLLQQCQQLQHLDVAIHPIWLVKGGLKFFEENHGAITPLHFDIPHFANNFKPLIKLQRMHIRLVTKSRWRYRASREHTKRMYIEKEEEELKVALPNVHITMDIEDWPEFIS